MLWIKSFHIIFVITWFAGLFYLPRFFVYHSMTDDEVLQRQYGLMERKLLGITHVGGALAVIFGVWLLVLYAGANPAYWSQGWLLMKLALVLLLVVYHGYCAVLVRQFANQQAPRRSHVWYRWFNELPVLLLIVIVLLVEFQPF